MSDEESRRSNERHGLGFGTAEAPTIEQWKDMFKQQFELALDLSDATLVGAERVCTARLEAARVSSETMLRALAGQVPWLQKPERDEPIEAKAA